MKSKDTKIKSSFRGGSDSVQKHIVNILEVFFFTLNLVNVGVFSTKVSLAFRKCVWFE